MPNITVTITDTEEKCLNAVMVGIGTWSTNFIKNRARQSKDEIIANLVDRLNLVDQFLAIEVVEV